jgi:hypothetical protein
MLNGHSPTDVSVRSGVTARYQNAPAVAVGQSQRLYSGVGVFTGNYLRSPLRSRVAERPALN